MSAEAVSPTSFRAFVLSSSLHAAIVALALLAGWTATREEDVGKVIELVAGEGDNFSAREAPALGVPGGISVPVPAAPAPRPAPTPEPVVERAAPPEPVTPAPAPVPAPAAPPAPKTPVAKDAVKADDAPPNFKKKIDYAIVRGDAKAKQQILKERKAEAKRVAEEKKRMSKEDFDRAQKGKTTAVTSGASAKVRIDGEGIAKGVVGGSTANKSGGAGGKSLKAATGNPLDLYDQYFKEELRRKFDPPPGLAETLKATFQVRSNADGSLGTPRVLKSSGSRQFDDAGLEAIRRMKLPARPDKKAENVEFTFSMRELSDG